LQLLQEKFQHVTAADWWCTKFWYGPELWSYVRRRWDIPICYWFYVLLKKV